MFNLCYCRQPGCKKPAISVISEYGELTDQRIYCHEHCPDPQKAANDICDYITKHDTIIGLTAIGIHFEDLDFSEKRFYGCNFSHSTFTRISSEGMRVRTSIFDLCTFSDCSLLKSNIRFSTFSGGTFSHTIFTGSDLIHNNFNGVTAYQSAFDNSDLFNSRFIRANLTNTSIVDCNIKKVYFYETAFENVSFKQTNTGGAFFSENGEKFI